jgi:CHAT domain-containing protein/tetratricopeptide (TPR) repeat protein
MNRSMTCVVCALLSTLVCVPVRADDPPKKLSAEQRKELEARWQELNTAGIKAYRAGMYPDAIKAFEDALNVARQLYNKAEFPDGHENLAAAMNNLASLYQAQGRLAAAEPLFKDTLEMHKRLFKDKDHPAVATSLNNLGLLYQMQGKLADAEPLYLDALEMKKRLFKDKDHADVSASLNNLGFLYRAQGKLAAAEPLYKEALEMRKRLFKDRDHPDLVLSLNNLATLYQGQGKLSAAEPLYKDALEMSKRLFKDRDHPDVASSLDNLGFLYLAQRKPEAAEPLLKDALEMRKRLFKDKDHPQLATSLNNLALLYRDQGKLADAEPLLKDALEMHKRLFKDKDHPQLATSLNNLAALYRTQRKLAAAEPLLKDALEMKKRLFKGQDHLDVAASLHNLGFLYHDQGKLVEAESLLKDALEMTKRLLVAFAKQKSEGEALTLAARGQATLDSLLSVARTRSAHTPSYDPATAYPALWSKKGMLARVYEQRQLQSRAAATDPILAKMLDQLTDARRRRAELLLAPATRDPGTLKKREEDLAALDKTIAQLNSKLPERLPAVARTDKLDGAVVADLQKALPADAALVDYVRYTLTEWDNDKPAEMQETWTVRYVAFVVMRDKVTWVDLDTAVKVEPAVNAWREAISGDAGRKLKPAPIEKANELGTKVRELVWAKVRTALPANIKTVYVCPDRVLCKVPFGALPGDKPDTIVLEDFAIATVPHAPFLLDQLWPQDPIRNPPTSSLVVGGVKYDADVGGGGKAPDPLVKSGSALGWSFLANTVGEANGVSDTAARKKLAVTRIEGEKATTAAVRAALPRAKYAHFATHGFFSDESFRGVFQLDEADYKQRGGERIGRAINNPLLMTGLVFAGANNEKTPGRGILTGEQLVDLDLSGLELAVLSACETGLGNVAGGEGTFGLQRAFHYAGARNVVCSLWKVPDESTAALMNLFYRNLWDKGMSSVEALRQAQLHLYRNPKEIPELAKGFRGKFEEVPGAGPEVEVKPAKDGAAHPLLWAAFTLSGPGR